VGGALFRFLHGHDVEALYHEEVYRTIVLDGLTGAYSRRYLFEQLEREMSRCQRHRRPLSLLVLDLDHFKRVNDELGHLSGDGVLRELVARIAGRLRPEDCLARLGGEAFAVVLPETELDAARALAEQLRATVAAEPFLANEELVTVSIGVAAMDGALREPDHFFAAADARLYEAKDAGRDCVRG
jgi:diguanylate cyclase (GGDEF)-like protein